ncbi:MAG: homoserine dehydrogenase [Thermoplasmata archaeon]|jgi:homoserine dehydrogenase|nr:homoserine dehydrogenase [Thermoplasmata archaeon]
MILRLAIIGFGNVGQEFARLLLSKREWLVKSKGLDIEVLAIATKSRGSLLAKRGLDLQRVLDELKSKGHLRDYGPEVTDLSPLSIIDECDADMLVELTTLDIETGQPAKDHISNALQAGLDVVTANKGPIAHSYDELRSMARSRNVRLRFEGTVMDGTPVFNLVERTLPGCEVIGLRGILNSTSNFVLTEMQRGRTMAEAIAEAQRRGFAEADPSLDIDGWDAAAKITALANVMMGARMTPQRVEREGIRGTGTDELARAKKDGARIRLVAAAKREGDGVRLTVRKEAVRPEDPFWAVDGTSSALTIRTDLMGDITILETDPTVTQTAYAVLSDMLLVVESIRAGTI